MAKRLCASCHIWLCAPDDAFCGVCRSPCADLRLNAYPSVLQAGQLSPRVGLKLVNCSCATLRIEGVDTPPWAPLTAEPPTEIGERKTAVFYVRPRTNDMDGPEMGELAVRTSGGSVSVTLLAIVENPEIVAKPGEIPVWFDEHTPSQSITFEMHPSAGSLRVVGFEKPREAWLQISDPVFEPTLVSAQRPINVPLEVMPPERKGVPLAGGTRVEVSLPIKFEGAHGVTSAPAKVRFAVRNPPECTWNEEHKTPPELQRTDRQRLSLHFSNNAQDSFGGRRNGNLAITSIDLSLPGNSTALAARLLTSLPLEIAGGATQALDFEINFDDAPPGDLQKLSLRVGTNRRSLDREYRIPVLLREVPEFPGIIAIDFGTSNTSCCLIEGGNIRSLPLDGVGSSAPTVVRYFDLAGAVPELDTGVTVVNLAAVDAQVAAATLSRLKQALGDEVHPIPVRPMRSAEWVTREPVQAAGDYLRYIRMAAEHKEKSIFREFVLTHPAVCSLRQFRSLRQALDDAFGRNAREIHFLQEPIAALIPFLSQLADKPDQPDYSVASFDLGGGTTDVTVIRVHHQRQGTGVEIQPEIVASWGERFGGENLTDFLVGELKARSGRLIAKNKPGYRPAADDVTGASTADTRRNLAASQRWAEIFKSSLSDDRGAGRVPRLVLRVIPDDVDTPPDEVGFDPADLDGAADESVETVFRRYLKEQVGRLARRLLRTVQPLATPLDYLQLSGKTTFLPVVAQVMAGLFPKTAIHRAKDPKECVVRGACLSRALSTGLMKRLILPASQRTTSRLGLHDDESRTFLEIIPYDCPIPEGGLSREMPNAWPGRRTPVAIWENLGAENSGAASDGIPNDLLYRIGIWEPEPLAPAAIGTERWTLSLKVTRDFALEVSAIGDGKTVRFAPRSSGGAR